VLRRLNTLRQDHHRAMHFGSGAVLLIAAALVTGIPGAALGLAAAVVVLDGLVPPPGTTLPEADERFCRAVRRRRRSALWARMRGRRPNELALLDDHALADRRPLGVLLVRIDTVVGTVEPGKARDFDGAFRPRTANREHWKRVWVAHAGQNLPPIAVYRVGGRHFVVDGHHRVSTARDHGAEAIEADVTEVRPP
jgi:hypothetical protein